MLSYDQINALAIRAGFSPCEVENWMRHQALAEFVKLIAERCAGICDLAGTALANASPQTNQGTAQACAQIIRDTYIK